jgi:hypothetical protein
MGQYIDAFVELWTSRLVIEWVSSIGAQRRVIYDIQNGRH